VPTGQTSTFPTPRRPGRSSHSLVATLVAGVVVAAAALTGLMPYQNSAWIRGSTASLFPCAEAGRNLTLLDRARDLPGSGSQLGWPSERRFYVLGTVRRTAQSVWWSAALRAAASESAMGVRAMAAQWSEAGRQVRTESRRAPPERELPNIVGIGLAQLEELARAGEGDLGASLRPEAPDDLGESAAATASTSSHPPFGSTGRHFVEINPRMESARPLPTGSSVAYL